jgi:hypothetical protein
VTCESPPNRLPDQSIPTTLALSPNPLSTSTNVCMMCLNGTHDDPTITVQKDFIRIKSLASRLIVDIHAGEIEKQLLR